MNDLKRLLTAVYLAGIAAYFDISAGCAQIGCVLAHNLLKFHLQQSAVP
jgi:hypothetical protein